jgi:hypothetical protein
VSIDQHRKLQVQETIAREVEIQKENKHHDILWEQDRQKKILREEADKLHFETINRNCMEILKEQLQNHRLKVDKEDRLERERALLLVIIYSFIVET